MPTTRVGFRSAKSFVFRQNLNEDWRFTWFSLDLINLCQWKQREKTDFKLEVRGSNPDHWIQSLPVSSIFGDSMQSNSCLTISLTTGISRTQKISSSDYHLHPSGNNLCTLLQISRCQTAANFLLAQASSSHWPWFCSLLRLSFQWSGCSGYIKLKSRKLLVYLRTRY